MSVNTPQQAAQEWERAMSRATAMHNASWGMRGQRGDPIITLRLGRRPPWWKRRARARFDLHARIARLEREVL